MDGRNQVREYLDSSDKFTEPEIESVEEGKNNVNYIFSSDEGKYVLRKARKAKEHETLRNERVVLEFLEAKRIDSAPRSINLDPQKNIHTVSFVGRESVWAEKLNQDDLRNWAKQLAQINTLTFEQFKDFCEESGYDSIKPEKQEDKIEGLYRDLEEIRGSGYKELTAFVEKKLDEVAFREPLELDQPFLMHSDIANSTRKTGDSFFFIDWEFAEFKYNQASDLAVILSQRDFTEQQIETLKNTFREELEITDNFEEKLLRAKKFRHLFNIVWCLKRASKGVEERKMVSYAERQSKKFSENI
ncbi:MAG: phosphotransferase [Candidatus Nanohalobium sp.]